MERCLDALSKRQTIYLSSLPAADNELVGNSANTFMRVELELFGPCLVVCPHYRLRWALLASFPGRALHTSEYFHCIMFSAVVSVVLPRPATAERRCYRLARPRHALLSPGQVSATVPHTTKTRSGCCCYVGAAAAPQLRFE